MICFTSVFYHTKDLVTAKHFWFQRFHKYPVLKCIRELYVPDLKCDKIIKYIILQNSLLTPKCSLLTRGSSLLTSQSSLLTLQSSLLTPESSLLTPQSSLLTPQSSLLTRGSSLLTPQSCILTPQNANVYNFNASNFRTARQIYIIFRMVCLPSGIKLVRSLNGPAFGWSGVRCFTVCKSFAANPTLNIQSQ